MVMKLLVRIDLNTLVQQKMSGFQPSRVHTFTPTLHPSGVISFKIDSEYVIWWPE